MSAFTKYCTASTLTAAGNTAIAFYKEARERGRDIKGAEDRDFEQSYSLAQQIDPGAVLEYIPIKERRSCRWSIEGRGWGAVRHFLRHPVKGELEWVGSRSPPEGARQQKLTKLFVCRGFVADNVKEVVVESRRRLAEMAGVEWETEGMGVKWETIGEWVRQAKDEWKKQVPEVYVGAITGCDMDEVWDLILARKMSKDQFGEWLDQRAWDNEQRRMDEEAAAQRAALNEEESNNVELCAALWAEAMAKQEEVERELEVQAVLAQVEEQASKEVSVRWMAPELLEGVVEQLPSQVRPRMTSSHLSPEDWARRRRAAVLGLASEDGTISDTEPEGLEAFTSPSQSDWVRYSADRSHGVAKEVAIRHLSL
jgi:hypothetical protein